MNIIILKSMHSMNHNIDEMLGLEYSNTRHICWVDWNFTAVRSRKHIRDPWRCDQIECFEFSTWWVSKFRVSGETIAIAIALLTIWIHIHIELLISPHDSPHDTIHSCPITFLSLSYHFPITLSLSYHSVTFVSVHSFTTNSLWTCNMDT